MPTSAKVTQMQIEAAFRGKSGFSGRAHLDQSMLSYVSDDDDALIVWQGGTRQAVEKVFTYFGLPMPTTYAEYYSCVNYMQRLGGRVDMCASMGKPAATEAMIAAFEQDDPHFGEKARCLVTGDQAGLARIHEEEQRVRLNVESFRAYRAAEDEESASADKEAARPGQAVKGPARVLPFAPRELKQRIGFVPVHALSAHAGEALGRRPTSRAQCFHDQVRHHGCSTREANGVG